MLGRSDALNWLDPVVPNPLDMGDEWYQVLETFIVDRLNWGPVTAVHFDQWKTTWKRYRIFKNDKVQTAIDEFHWSMWSEGIELLGLDS